MVIESHPVDEDGEPFPTLYWLTCPILVKRVSKLESEGAMAEMNEKLKSDPPLRSRLADAIEAYVGARDDHAVIADAGTPPGGGPDRVKCLHAHVAHELVEPSNPVGALTLAATGWPDCTAACVELRP
ncbi:MAG: DUF501 domain-containing protein [Actinomycetota bacterium]|nr:DUF501 domain-containing protein [Actinomycetota bacterium]